jgi:hypothetical protein
MSVLIIPLDGGDAIIMTQTLTTFLRHVEVIIASGDRIEDRSRIVLFTSKDKETIYNDQLCEVRERLLDLNLVYKSDSSKTIFPKINVICAYKNTQSLEKYTPIKDLCSDLKRSLGTPNVFCVFSVF